MPPVHSGRRRRLLEAVATLDVDAVLLTRPVNVRYLTGFTGSNAALLLSPVTALLATDGRYVLQAAAQSPDVDLLLERAVAPALVAHAQAGGMRRVLVEAHGVTLGLAETLRAVAPQVELVPARAAVEAMREVKDDDELAALTRACAISDRALAEVLPTVAVGRTEREIARELEHRMSLYGAEAPAFPSIVAGGPHSAVPHHEPTDRPLRRGDLLKIDFGARYDGYHADMTRTFVVGAEPADWQREIHAVVAAAQRAGRDALAPGVSAREVDAVARRVVADAGYAEAFPHGLGHGVGLEIHEAPMLGSAAEARLGDRVPVTVEPGVYLPGRGGVRIEDTLVVRDGAPSLLTTTSRELLVLGT